ncbi:hypothetical protein Syun_000604 [Stephania yunnanensis]|uniref:Uncharacterized protein n=1 Tax=Stephania yunnanensis TaxID=152371 RepID=A0AAP0LGA5_9MAGN
MLRQHHVSANLTNATRRSVCRRHVTAPSPTGLADLSSAAAGPRRPCGRCCWLRHYVGRNRELLDRVVLGRSVPRRWSSSSSSDLDNYNQI